MQVVRQGIKKKVSIKVDNKLDAYGETDLNTNKIRINKKRHSQKGYKRINPTKNGNENLVSTIQHELLHVKHPKAHEKTIRKMEKSSVRKMSPKRKKQLLGYLR